MFNTGGYGKFSSFYQYGSGEVLSRSIRMSQSIEMSDDFLNAEITAHFE